MPYVTSISVGWESVRIGERITRTIKLYVYDVHEMHCYRIKVWNLSSIRDLSNCVTAIVKVENRCEIFLILSYYAHDTTKYHE